jgi:hypothetical protein
VFSVLGQVPIAIPTDSRRVARERRNITPDLGMPLAVLFVAQPLPDQTTSGMYYDSG